MKAEFTAIIEAVPEGGYWAICPELIRAASLNRVVPGRSGSDEIS